MYGQNVFKLLLLGELNSLDAHTPTLHFLFSDVFPTQSAPPCAGEGSVQLRLRVCVPSQALLHFPQELHPENPPLTKNRKKI